MRFAIHRTSRVVGVIVLLLVAVAAFAQDAQNPPLRVNVSSQLSASGTSGRLLVFISKRHRKQLGPQLGSGTIDYWVLAKEVRNLSATSTADFWPDAQAFPSSAASIPPGDYYVQAILDANHNYAYNTHPDGGDLVSPVVRTKVNAGKTVQVELASRVPAAPVKTPRGSEPLDFVSPSLSAYHGREIHMRGFVVLPPSYQANTSQTYPIVYVTLGFTAELVHVAETAEERFKAMEKGDAPEMIYAVLDQSTAWGTHEFADSLTNGPWGKALTSELVPYIENKYRTDARPSSRFLTGHSSGGWSSIWLQTAYPDVFGGAWPTAPDPVDFRSFVGIDLTKDRNMYRRADGTARPLMRLKGKVVETIEGYSRLERVLGEYGGQMRSFEAVFSPRGEDSQPEELYDRDTGEINPEVVRYWERYDVSAMLRKNWANVGPKVSGKIHLVVGDVDNFYLEESASLLQQTLSELGGAACFEYVAHRDHINLYSGNDLANRIAREMYAVARPPQGVAQNASACPKPYVSTLKTVTAD